MSITELFYASLPPLGIFPTVGAEGSSISPLPLYSSTLLLLVTAAAIYAFYCWRQGRELPPGPPGLPLLGRLPWADALCLNLTMQRECERYGDVCSFYLGSRLFVVVNSHPLLKEMLDNPLFAGRPRLRLFEKMTRNCGIFLVEGRAWSRQRRVSLRTLRDFGFARARAVGMVEDQLGPLLQSLDAAAADAAEPVRVLDVFLRASNSIITEMMLGRRIKSDDKDFSKVMGLIATTLESSISETACFLFPVAERLLDLVPMSTRVVRDIECLHEFFRAEIRVREQAMAEEDAVPTCFCDAYLLERRKAEAAGDFESFKEFQLIRICLEFYLAGTDTTARSLEWLLLYMSFYPDVQEKVQKELDEVLGDSRRPQLEDRTQLHYTCAVIDEGYRKASLAAIGVFHRAVEDTNFHGYRIPSDAIIIPLVYGVHHRPEYWQKPNEFYPEHFLDGQGRYRSSNYLIPFLIGRRACVGESLARMEVFLFFTAVMQRYRVRPTPESLARKEEILRGRMGSLRVPGDCRLAFSRR